MIEETLCSNGFKLPSGVMGDTEKGSLLHKKNQRFFEDSESIMPFVDALLEILDQQVEDQI